ncbi:MAG: hypothetical protein ACJAUU_001225 [Rickettsiales bacterium]|jgi:hypothetical protein
MKTSNGSNSFDRTFILSLTDGFDDILIFKTKAQLVKDTGLEFIMCNQNEAATAASNTTCGSIERTWTSNGNYGDNVPYAASGAVCMKTCGKYGIWSSEVQNTPTTAFLAHHTSLSPVAEIGNGTNWRFPANASPISFTNEIFDDTGIFDAPNSTFKVKIAGKYVISCNLMVWRQGYNNRLNIYVRLNKIDTIGYLFNPEEAIVASSYVRVNNPYLMDLDVDDEVKIWGAKSRRCLYGIS